MTFARRLARILAKPAALALLIATVALVYGGVSMARYGLTFDSPSLFYAGDRTLFWLQHRKDEHALDLDQRTEPPGFQTPFERSPDFEDPMHYPVFPGVVCALTSRLFHDRLHWVDAIDGHHLGLLFLHVIGLFFFCRYLTALLGRVAGVAGTVTLALFPCALASSFNNAKDWPCALFYGVALLAIATGVVHARGRTVAAGAFFLGVSLASKLQAIFVFPTLALWAPIAYAALHFRRKPMRASVVGWLLAAPYVAGAMFFVSWPWLWHGKQISDYWDHLAEYLRFMVHYGISARETWSAWPLKMVAYTTPPLVLFGALAYAIYGWTGVGSRRPRREHVAIWALFLLWFAFPLWRSCRPHATFYGGNRHFFEYMPALCAMMGGAVALAAHALGKIPLPRLRVAAWATAGAAGLACLIAPIVAYRPYEILYFNALAGGLGKAQANAVLFMPAADPQTRKEHNASGAEADFWFTSLRDAIRQARAYIPRDGKMGFCGPWTAQVKENGGDRDMTAVIGDAHSLRDVPIVYVAPEGNVWGCTYAMARDMEKERPILWRVTREGGLVYEVLGARDGKSHPVVTPPNAYDKLLGT